MAKNRMQRTMQDVKSVQSKYKKAVSRISAKGEKAITMMLISVQNRAAEYTPQDSNNLINSQYRQVVSETPTRITGRVGYTAGYAARLHDNTDWNLLTPAQRNPQGGAYNPMGRPFFLRDGAQEASEMDFPKILRATYGDQ